MIARTTRTTLRARFEMFDPREVEEFARLAAVADSPIHIGRDEITDEATLYFNEDAAR